MLTFVPAYSYGARLRRLFLVAIVLIGVLWFAGLNVRALFRPDEGRYADIPAEMLATGNWITPRLDALKYFEKPPLQYWATATAFALVGEHGWSARLWTALTGFLGVLLLVFAGNRLGPPGAGYLAGLIAASSWGYILTSQYLTLDMGLTFFMTLTLVAFLLAHHDPSDARANRRWMLVVWAAMACAMLTKGLEGIVLPGLTLIVYVIVQRDWTVLQRLQWRNGLLLFALLALPWFVIVQLRNPEFFHYFFVYQHFDRYLEPTFHRSGPWWYFLPIVLVGLMPWTPALPGAFARSAKRGAPGGQLDVDRLLLLWAVVIVAFFSFSKSKLPGYVIPALPALALLIARDMVRRTRVPLRWLATFALVAGVGVLAFARRLPSLPRAHDMTALVAGYAPWLAAAGALMVLGAALSWILARRGWEAAVLGLALASLASVQVGLWGAYRLDGYYSSRAIVRQIGGSLDVRFAPEVPFYSVGMFDQSLPFYLGRPVTLVHDRSELRLGIAAEPWKYIPTLRAFARRWKSGGAAYAIMEPPMYKYWQHRALPMRLVARDGVRVVVARTAAQHPALLPRSPGWLPALVHRLRP